MTRKRTSTKAPKTRPLRLSPGIARALDEWARELSAGGLATVSRASLARALLAWGLTERPKPSDLSAALALVEGEGPAVEGVEVDTDGRGGLRLAPAA